MVLSILKHILWLHECVNKVGKYSEHIGCCFLIINITVAIVVHFNCDFRN